MVNPLNLSIFPSYRRFRKGLNERGNGRVQ